MRLFKILHAFFRDTLEIRLDLVAAAVVSHVWLLSSFSFFFPFLCLLLLLLLLCFFFFFFFFFFFSTRHKHSVWVCRFGRFSFPHKRIAVVVRVVVVRVVGRFKLLAAEIVLVGRGCSCWPPRLLLLAGLLLLVSGLLFSASRIKFGPSSYTFRHRRRQLSPSSSHVIAFFFFFFFSFFSISPPLRMKTKMTPKRVAFHRACTQSTRRALFSS